MQLTDFFQTVSKPDLEGGFMSAEDTISSVIQYGLNEEQIELSDFDAVIIGVADTKNSQENSGGEFGVDSIRKQLAKLRKNTRSINILDLGNVKGATLNDRYVALYEVLEILKPYNVVSIIIGGGQDYLLPLVKSLTKENNDIAMSLIDAKLDFCVDNQDYCSRTYLTKLSCEFSSSIYEMNVLGVQNYFLGEKQEAKMRELHWEFKRLKDLRGEQIKYSEPLLRDADIISFDSGAIEYAYMPYYTNHNVNGFSGNEACQLAWYSGLSENLRCFCFHDYNPTIDERGTGGVLSAQILWHLLEGISHKMNDMPKEGGDNYKISIVHLQDFDADIRFYTNRVNNRWWIEVPWKNAVKKLACDKSDYILAQSGELPDKWWRFFQKSTLD